MGAVGCSPAMCSDIDRRHGAITLYDCQPTVCHDQLQKQGSIRVFQDTCSTCTSTCGGPSAECDAGCCAGSMRPRQRAANSIFASMELPCGHYDGVVVEDVAEIIGFDTDGFPIYAAKMWATDFLARNRTEFHISPEGEVDRGDQDHRRVKGDFLAAARSGQFKRLAKVLAAGADIQWATVRGENAMMLAAAAPCRENLQIIDLLMSKLISMDSRDHNGWTPLLHACRNSNEDTITFLLAKGAKLDVNSYDGIHAAMLAAHDNNDSLAISLIEKGLSISHVDKTGRSMLFHACERGRSDLVRWLLNKRANANDSSLDRSTVLMVAAGHGHMGILKNLIKRRAAVNDTNKDGNTALILSIKGNHADIAVRLIQGRADVTNVNKDDENAGDLAKLLRMGHVMTLIIRTTRGDDENKPLEDLNERSYTNDSSMTANTGDTKHTGTKQHAGTRHASPKRSATSPQHKN